MSVTPPVTGRAGRGARVRLTLVGLFRAPAAPRQKKRHPARVPILWFAVGVLALHVAALAALDAEWPNLRDPEYGWRARRLRARAVEHPARPVVVLVGSSRTCMGVKPSAWEAVRPGAPADPLLFNFGTVGAGPIQQLITVRRLFADGFRPNVVLLEYWPPLLRQDGMFAEQRRVGARLRLSDVPVVHDYFHEPDRALGVMRETRLNPIFANRDRWAALAFPGHLSANRHMDLAWRDLDRWGWLPGLDVKPHDADTRAQFLERSREDNRRQLDGHSIHPDSGRAFHETVALARAHGARVGFLFLPESSEYRNGYPPEVERHGSEYLEALAGELNAPVINAREWMSDNLLADGHHLSRVGAGAFTERLGPAISKAFPTGGGGR